MNILTDALPDSVELSGITVHVRADHRSCIRAIVALLDNDVLEETAAILVALQAFYPDIPDEVGWEEAFSAMTTFLQGAPVPPLPAQKKSVDGSSPAERAYSFLYDQEIIYSAFWQQYHIDLAHDTLHWWIFRALLNGLHDNYMAEIMRIRTAREEPGMSSEQKKLLRKDKSHWKLPALAQENKQADAIAQALLNGGEGLEEALGRA